MDVENHGSVLIIFQQCLLRFGRVWSSSFSQIDVNKDFLWFLPDSLEILTFEAFEALSILDQGNLLRGIDNCYGYKSVRRPWTTVLESLLYTVCSRSDRPNQGIGLVFTFYSYSLYGNVLVFKFFVCWKNLSNFCWQK